jgi:hypothetical protein
MCRIVLYIVLYAVLDDTVTALYNMYCAVLCWAGLGCAVLYCIVLCCIVLYCIVLYCAVLYCVVPHRTALFCIVLYCIVTVLHCTVLYSAVLRINMNGCDNDFNAELHYHSYATVM